VNLRRFSNPAGLKAIKSGHLTSFLNPFGEFLCRRGMAWPPAPGRAPDLDALVAIVMSPDTDTPPTMADGLWLVHEMATNEGMSALLEEARFRGLRLSDDPDLTPADVAVQIWLQAPQILARKHSEQSLTRKRSFEYFQTDAFPLPDFTPPSPEVLSRLAAGLDEWFVDKKRGRGTQVLAFSRDDGVWFLVRHGEPFKREGCLDDGQSSSVFYRPEKYDVLVYDPKAGELRMNTRSKGEKELYRAQFGLHLFGREDFFPSCQKYTLEPLRTHGAESLVCTDVEGMDWVRLREVQLYWGGAHGEIDSRRADDLLAAMAERGAALPAGVPIIHASFEVKFSDARTPRTVAIRTPGKAQYTRDSDSAVVEDWLAKRGFIRSRAVEEQQAHEAA